MSKSLGNYIGVDDAPDDMYGKVLSLPDYSHPFDVEGALAFAPMGTQSAPRGHVPQRNTIVDYFGYLTDVPDDELAEMRRAMEDGSGNPLEMKKRLARELVTQFHGAEAARLAEASFERTVQRGETPDDMDAFRLPPASELEGMRISHVLVAANLVASTGEARRLINQGAVQVDGERLAEDGAASALSAGSVIRVGRRRFVRLADDDGA
jgi:tyrosyl-tRNA synthetase